MNAIFIILILWILNSFLFSLISIVGPLSLAFIPLWIILGLVSALLVSVIWLLILIYVILPHQKMGSKIGQKLVYPWVKLTNRLARIHLEVEGRENIPTDTFVLFANHKSMLDITVVYEALNRPVSAIAKSELSTVPVLKTLCKDFFVEYVDRNNDREAVKSLLKAIKKVEQGLSYFIFPEGGVKSRDTELMVELRPGAYKLATKPKAIIFPASILGTNKLKTNAFKKRTNVKVIFHKPITYEEYKDLNTQEIGEKVFNIVNEAIVNERQKESN